MLIHILFIITRMLIPSLILFAAIIMSSLIDFAFPLNICCRSLKYLFRHVYFSKFLREYFMSQSHICFYMTGLSIRDQLVYHQINVNESVTPGKLLGRKNLPLLFAKILHLQNIASDASPLWMRVDAFCYFPDFFMKASGANKLVAPEK